MRITHEADYAVRITYTLMQSEEPVVAASKLAELSGVTLRFTLKILRKLAAAGIVTAQKGANGSAVMFSLIQTAIENGLNPYKYLTWLLRKAKDADLEDGETIQTLLPWNAAAECRSK